MQTHYTVSNLIDAKNLKQLSLIGTMPVENTMYFFCREEKILLPMIVSDLNIDSTITNYDMRRLVYNIAKFFHGSLEKVIITWREESTYITYVRITKNKSNYDFILNIDDALHLGLRFNVPIFISTQLLLTDGIKVTKEILENYLK